MAAHSASLDLVDGVPLHAEAWRNGFLEPEMEQISKHRSHDGILENSYSHSHDATHENSNGPEPALVALSHLVEPPRPPSPPPDGRIIYEDMEDICDYIRQQTDIIPEIGVVCGSGLGGLADHLDPHRPQTIIHYKDIPKFPTCHVRGHAGNLVFGYFAGQPTVCMQGRFHCYEGHSVYTVTMPIRVLHLLGVKTLVVTNASGGLNSHFNIGDIMIIKDHINLAGMSGFNPLIGENDRRFGPRFPALTSAYDKQLRKLVHEAATELGMTHYLQEGVYVHLTGPNYETPAEARFLRLIGADTVGMSTAPEVVVAKHCGMRVLGLSLVTNKVVMDYDSDIPPPTHQEVMDTATKRAKDLEKLVKTTLHKLVD